MMFYKPSSLAKDHLGHEAMSRLFGQWQSVHFRLHHQHSSICNQSPGYILPHRIRFMYPVRTQLLYITTTPSKHGSRRITWKENTFKAMFTKMYLDGINSIPGSRLQCHFPRLTHSIPVPPISTNKLIYI